MATQANAASTTTYKASGIVNACASSFESKQNGPGLGFEADETFLIDEIKAIRPTGALMLNFILDSIDQMQGMGRGDYARRSLPR
jgi:hypothetical protein